MVEDIVVVHVPEAMKETENAVHLKDGLVKAIHVFKVKRFSTAWKICFLTLIYVPIN